MKTKIKGEFDGRIWPTILEFNIGMDNHLTSKANFLFGAATAILFYAINKENQSIDARMFILIGGSFVSMVSAMMVVMPRIWIFSRKERIKEDIFYYKNILRYYTRSGYMAYLKNLPIDEIRISKAYANQIYTLSTYIIPYKSKLVKISGWTLLGSILIYAVTMIIL